MKTLIDDLLNFSRLSHGTVRSSEIDMSKMVRTIFHELTGSKARKRIKFNIFDLPLAEGDPTMIHEVWQNLISNAIKYSSHRKQAEISISCIEKNDELIYQVKDNGAGFDMKYRDKLFEVFKRLHNDSEFNGTGVGLALVKRIINRHGGQVWGVGEVGKGATFYFALPKK